MNPLSFFCLAAVSLLMVSPAEAATAGTKIQTVKITLLSTMLADGSELGEWGFAALVEADGHRLLFDTGAHTDVVLKNVKSLKLQLSPLPEVILSHSHSDHVGGFLTLREAVRAETPDSLARTHVGEGIFYPRRSAGNSGDDTSMARIKAAYEKMGGTFVVHTRPAEIHPGIWLTGPVPRKYPERNWSGSDKVVTPAGVVDDTLPEDMAMIIETSHGLVVLTGCGHAGVINILDQAREITGDSRVHALIGGVHLFSANETTLQWTQDKMRPFGIEYFLGAHCTGLETVYRFRGMLNLDRAHAVVGAVGAKFELGKGIDPRQIAK